MKWLILFLLFPLTCLSQTVVYPNWGILSSSYTVTVNTQNSPVQQVDAGGCPSTQCLLQHKNNVYNITVFSCSATVSVTVTKHGSAASTATIRPNELGIGTLTTSLSGGNASVIFNLPPGTKASVEYSDDPNYNNDLVISADPLETNVPNPAASTTFLVTDSASLRSIPGGKTCVYFAAGPYKIGRWTVPSGITQIYMAGGAYVKGYILYAHSPLLTLNGRGILTADGYVYHYPNPGSGSSANWYYLFYQQGGSVAIDGITFLKPSAFTIVSSGTSLVINDINLIGPFYNNDGTTNYTTTTSISNSFYQDEDDAWVLKNGGFTAYNNTIWQLQGGIVKVGFKPLSLNGITVRKTFITHDENPFTDYNQGFIDANFGGNSTLPTLVQNGVVDSAWFNTPVKYVVNISNDYYSRPIQVYWQFQNWTFSHIFISQSTYSAPMFYIKGFSACYPSTGFSFSNVTLNGSSAPLGNPAFFSTLHYNVSPQCGTGGLVIKLNGVVKFKH